MSLNPDCRDKKHAACAGDAWDDENDTAANCDCTCHTSEAGTTAQSARGSSDPQGTYPPSAARTDDGDHESPSARRRRIAEVRELLANATPGPWDGPSPEEIVEFPDARWIAFTNSYMGRSIVWSAPMPDADPIAHAPDDLAWLIGEVEQLRATPSRWPAWPDTTLRERAASHVHYSDATTVTEVMDAVLAEAQADIDRLRAEARYWRTQWDRHGKNDLIAEVEQAEARLKRVRALIPRWNAEGDYSDLACDGGCCGEPHAGDLLAALDGEVKS